MVPAPRRLPRRAPGGGTRHRRRRAQDCRGNWRCRPRGRRRTGSRSARGAAAGSNRTSASSCPTTARPSVRAPGSKWRVQVRTDAGISAWSAWSWWETGLLRTDDWSARWISPVEVDPLPPAGERPASVLRTRFTVSEPRSSARIHATAHGLYELFLDGERVGDQELAPGYTSYRSRVQVQTYDVTTLLGAGEHELRAVLSDGWYRGKVGFTREHDSYGSQLALLAQVEVDGVVVAATDAAWTERAECDCGGRPHRRRVGRPARPRRRPRVAAGRGDRRRLRRALRVTRAPRAEGRAAPPTRGS